MKKFIFSALLLSLSIAASAQIKTLNIEEKLSEIIPYDSLKNIAWPYPENLETYVGQTLYLMPFKKRETHKGDFNRSTEGNNYDNMKGKYFEIIGVRKGARYDDINLQLVETETRDTIYKRSYYSNDVDNFVIVGYFEKLQSRVIGRKFYYSGNGLQGYSHPLTNVEDRQVRTDIPKGTVFDAVDIVVDESYNDYGNYTSPIIVILENTDYGRVFVSDEEIEKSLYKSNTDAGFVNFIPYEEYQRKLAMTAERKAMLIKKYGTTNGTLISEEKVKLGFTKQMCIDSWGQPSDINKSTGSWGTHEQWVYGSESYLYFENGILTSIQN